MVEVAGIDVDRILIFAALAIGTIAVGLIARALVERLFRERLEGVRNSKLIARAVEYSVFFVGFYFAFNFLMGFNPIAFAASLGLISIAVAFSSQQLIQNFIAGVLIALTRPIRLEDWVEIGNSGLSKVNDITLTFTILHNIDGRIILMPNSAALSSSVTNYSKAGHVQIPLRIEIPASADLEKVKNIIYQILDSIEDVHHTPNESEPQRFTQLLSRFHRSTTKIDAAAMSPHIMIVNISPSTLTLEIRVWIDDFRRRDLIKAELMDALSARLVRVENPTKVDDKMLSVLRQMLDEMKERQAHLEDLIAQREVEGEVRAR